MPPGPRRFLIYSRFTLACLCCFLASCLPAKKLDFEPPTSQPSATPVTGYIFITATPQQKTATPRQIDITSTPPPTPFPLNSLPVFEFPDGLTNSETNLFVVNLGSYDESSPSVLSVLNPVSGERFDLPGIQATGYFWMPYGRSLGVISDRGEVMLLDLYTGEKTFFIIPAEMMQKSILSVDRNGDGNFRLFGYFTVGKDVGIPTFSILEWGNEIPENIGDANIVLLDRYSKRTISSDRKFLAQYQASEVKIIDTKSGDVSLYHPAGEDEEILSVAWSPVAALVSVEFGYSRIAFVTDIDGYPIEFERYFLRIYDVRSGEWIGEYEDVGGNVLWSPDGSQILYIYKGPSLTGNPPCILNWEVARTICYSQLLKEHANLNFNEFQWSPDDTKISYLLDGSQLCFLDISSDTISCFEHILGMEPGYMIESYEWSPDGSFISINIGCASFCIAYEDGNYITHPYIGILSILDGDFWLVGNTLNDAGIWSP